MEIKKTMEIKKVEKIEKKPKQQPKQGNLPRKTQSNVSNQSATAGMVDCVFVVDTTGSMDIYLEKTTDAVMHLVERVKE